MGLSSLRPVAGQGLLVPTEPRRPELPGLEKVHVEAVSLEGTLRDQVAEVQISQVFVNTGSREMQVAFCLPVPESATVQDFVLMVDGQEWAGKLLPADEARAIYEDIVRRRQDPALLEYMGRGMIRTSVFPIPAQGRREVTLKTTMLCPMQGGTIDFSYPLATLGRDAVAARSYRVDLRLASSTAIKSIYSPTHEVQVEREGDDTARVSWNREGRPAAGMLRLLVAVAPGEVGAQLYSVWPSGAQDGYFMLLAAPEIRRSDKPLPAKTVMFVVDQSGSMSGKKIEQARGALEFVLNNLNEGDLFNIVAYSDAVDLFSPELVRADNESLARAQSYVQQQIRAGGSTNIDRALDVAMGQLQDDERPAYVLFLTDGLPTAGEQNELRIAENFEARNTFGARMINFGVGYDVNARLLDRLARLGGGMSHYVSPGEDIEAKVADFYAAVTSPLLDSIALEFDGAPVNRVFPRRLPDLFAGGQLVVLGRYGEAGPVRVGLEGRVGGEARRFDFDFELAAKGGGAAYDFVERLWATRRIGAIIDEIDLHGQNEELVRELTELSTRYGILTPYTAFLADERTDLAAVSRNAVMSSERLGQLDEVSGRGGQAQRAVKNQLLFAAPAATAMAMDGEAESSMIVMDTDGHRQVIETVRQIGPKAFYLREGRWVDATLADAGREPDARLVQFSDAFFELTRNLTPVQNRMLNFSEPVLVEIEGRLYAIDPPTE